MQDVPINAQVISDFDVTFQDVWSSLRDDRKFCVLLVLRLLCSILPGYVHPDEYFQSQEVSLHGTL